jgi:hypothetical protein
MLEAARILAGIALMSLIVAIIAWANPSRQRQLRRLNGSAIAHRDNLLIAARMLLAAVGLSGLGAALAIAGWFAT